MENYVSVEVGCLRFLDSYRFLNSSLDKLMKSMQSAANSFPIMDENGLDDEIFKKKLAYPYEYKSNHLNSDEHKNKTKQQHNWCEDCGKYISISRRFQSEIHTLRSQNNAAKNATALAPTLTSSTQSGVKNNCE